MDSYYVYVKSLGACGLSIQKPQDFIECMAMDLWKMVNLKIW